MESVAWVSPTQRGLQLINERIMKAGA